VKTNGQSWINLHPDSTWYQFMHEFTHELKFREIGRDVEAWKGVGEFAREQAVYDHLRQNYWNSLRREERIDAIANLRRRAKDLGGTPVFNASDINLPYPGGKPIPFRLKPPGS
jgi:hypothetical protein